MDTVNGFEHFTQGEGGVSVPQSFPGKPEFLLVDTSDATIDGWLAMDDGNLTRVERNLMSSFVASFPPASGIFSRSRLGATPGY